MAAVTERPVEGMAAPAEGNPVPSLVRDPLLRYDRDPTLHPERPVQTFHRVLHHADGQPESRLNLRTGLLIPHNEASRRAVPGLLDRDPPLLRIGRLLDQAPDPARPIAETGRRTENESICQSQTGSRELLGKAQVWLMARMLETDETDLLMNPVTEGFGLRPPATAEDVFIGSRVFLFLVSVGRETVRVEHDALDGKGNSSRYAGRTVMTYPDLGIACGRHFSALFGFFHQATPGTGLCGSHLIHT